MFTPRPVAPMNRALVAPIVAAGGAPTITSAMLVSVLATMAARTMMASQIPLMAVRLVPAILSCGVDRDGRPFCVDS